MKKSEMEQKFREHLEQKKDRMADELRKGDREQAWIVAWEIFGAAAFAQKLEIIDWDQMRSIQDEALADYQGKEDPLDEVC